MFFVPVVIALAITTFVVWITVVSTVDLPAGFIPEGALSASVATYADDTGRYG